MSLPSPPDGAPIAGLDERRRWLSQLHIVYQLPSEGILVVGTEFSISIESATIRARTAAENTEEEVERERELSEAERAELALLWTGLWTAPPSETASVFLRYRGVFRTVGAPDELALMSWISRLLDA